MVHWLGRLERALLALLMLGMTLLYGGAVIVREIAPGLAGRIAWVDEAARILMVWLVFSALGLALERGRQVAMTTLLHTLPATPRRAIYRLIDACGALFAFYLAWLGIKITLFVLQSGQISPTLGVSMAWLYAAVPAGFGLLGLRYTLSLGGFINRRLA